MNLEIVFNIDKDNIMSLYRKSNSNFYTYTFYDDDLDEHSTIVGRLDINDLKEYIKNLQNALYELELLTKET